MADIQAMPLDEFGLASPTDDGQHVILQAHVGGRPTVLAIRQEDVFRLMALLSKAASGTALAKDPHTGGEHAYPITAVSSRSARQGDGIVLTAQIPGGMQFSFVGTQSVMTALGAELSVAASTDKNAPSTNTEGRVDAAPAVEQAQRHRLTDWLRGTTRATS